MSMLNKLKTSIPFKPAIITTFKEGYSSKQLLTDISAGIVVGIVALPLAIAFAIASGVSPEKGMITAVVAGFIISLLGGSRVQIGGPTGAFIIIVSGIVTQYGFQGLLIATLMAGILLVIMGIAKLGSVIKFIPHPIIVGFTAGIALTIFSTQIKDLFGLQVGDVPSDFIEKWYFYFLNFTKLNWQSSALGIGAVLFIVLWQYLGNNIKNVIFQKFPGSLLVIVLGTLIVTIFGLDIDTIGSRFGAIPTSIPEPTIPSITFSTIKELISPAITIAILGAIESLLSAVVADGIIGTKHKSNTELIAQGIANIISPLVGGIPATGAIARTATNIKNGGRTPVAGIVHSIVLLLIMLFFGKYALLIPMPILAAVLVVVSYNMSGWRLFKGIYKSSKGDFIILSITFILTVVFDLTVAIYSGMILAAFIFMRRMILVSNVDVIYNDMKNTSHNMETDDDPNAIWKKNVPKDVDVFELSGPFFFGAANRFRDGIDRLGHKPKILIIRMRQVPMIDATGVKMLEQLYEDIKKEGRVMILSGVHYKVDMVLRRTDFIELIGEENVLGNIDDALDRAREILGLEKEGRPENFVPTTERDVPIKNKY